MQDASAQMALLQFMTCGMSSTAVPASIHCDHLIVGKDGAEEDLVKSIATNKEVLISCKVVVKIRYSILGTRIWYHSSNCFRELCRTWFNDVRYRFAYSNAGVWVQLPLVLVVQMLLMH